MEWSFDSLNGVVTVRQEGKQALCQAIRKSKGDGLYKAWLLGKQGRALLGTLIPEGGALRLRRSIPVSQLQQQGAWPPVGAEIKMAQTLFSDTGSPAGWSWTDRPERLFASREEARIFRGIGRGLYRKEENGFSLAYPYFPEIPFPAPPLFCLCSLERLEGKWYVIFHFSCQGRPELLHISSTGGKTTEGI